MEIKKLNDINKIKKEKLELEKARLSQQKEFKLEQINKEMKSREKEKLYQLDIEKEKLKKEENIERKTGTGKNKDRLCVFGVRKFFILHHDFAGSFSKLIELQNFSHPCPDLLLQKRALIKFK